MTALGLPLGFLDPRPSDFNRLAADAARLGQAAIPALMLAARDGQTLRAQLCAIKALGMISHPTAVEARRRISLLELDGDRGRVVRGAFPTLGVPFGEPWDADAVVARLIGDDWDPVAFHEREEARQQGELDVRRLKKRAETAERRRILQEAASVLEERQRRAEARERVEQAEAAQRRRIGHELRMARQARERDHERLERDRERLERDRERLERDRERPERDRERDAAMKAAADLASLRRLAPRLPGGPSRPIPIVTSSPYAVGLCYCGVLACTGRHE